MYVATLGLSKMHPVSQLHEVCKRLNYPKPEFIEHKENDLWSCEVKVGDELFKCAGAKTRKKEARIEASKHVLKVIGIHK